MFRTVTLGTTMVLFGIGIGTAAAGTTVFGGNDSNGVNERIDGSFLVAQGTSSTTAGQGSAPDAQTEETDTDRVPAAAATTGASVTTGGSGTTTGGSASTEAGTDPSDPEGDAGASTTETDTPRIQPSN